MQLHNLTHFCVPDENTQSWVFTGTHFNSCDTTTGLILILLIGYHLLYCVKLAFHHHMTWIKILQSIYQTLDNHRLNQISQQIQGEQLKGGTSGEMFNFVLSELMSIKERRPEVYALIKEEQKG